MDERIKNGYTKLYAELARLIIYICAASTIIKMAFYHKNAVDCLPEYIILIGSPLYIAIRSRFLGITAVPVMPTAKKMAQKMIIFCAIFFPMLMFVSRQREQHIDWNTVTGFGIPFALLFLAISYFYQKWEWRRQQKLDSHYEDSND